MNCSLYVVLCQMIYFGIYICSVSFITFVLFGVDKYKARKGLWRLSENNLLTCVALGGGLGALVGMEVFRHKTVKGAFLWKFWLILLLWLCVVIVGLIQG